MLGTIIKRYRKERGWKQQTLAEKTGLSQNYISDLENDARTGSMDVHQRLADAFGVTLSRLLHDADLAIMPPEVAALQASGVPDDELQELTVKWPDLTQEDRDLILKVLRMAWDRHQTGTEHGSTQKANRPQPATGGV